MGERASMRELLAAAEAMLDHIKQLRSMSVHPVVFQHHVMNFADPDGSREAIYRAAMRLTGETRLTIEPRGDESRPEGKSLWADRWPIDLNVFWGIVRQLEPR